MTRQEPDLVRADWDLPQLSGMDLLATLCSRGDVTPFGLLTSRRTSTRRRVDLSVAITGHGAGRLSFVGVG